jgi:hypothetical protein
MPGIVALGADEHQSTVGVDDSHTGLLTSPHARSRPTKYTSTPSRTPPVLIASGTAAVS